MFYASRIYLNRLLLCGFIPFRIQVLALSPLSCHLTENEPKFFYKSWLSRIPTFASSIVVQSQPSSPLTKLFGNSTAIIYAQHSKRRSSLLPWNKPIYLKHWVSRYVRQIRSLNVGIIPEILLHESLNPWICPSDDSCWIYSKYWRVLTGDSVSRMKNIWIVESQS